MAGPRRLLQRVECFLCSELYDFCVYVFAHVCVCVCVIKPATVGFDFENSCVQINQKLELNAGDWALQIRWISLLCLLLQNNKVST